jgi:hypothetical protein
MCSPPYSSRVSRPFPRAALTRGASSSTATSRQPQSTQRTNPTKSSTSPAAWVPCFILRGGAISCLVRAEVPQRQRTPRGVSRQSSVSISCLVRAEDPLFEGLRFHHGRGRKGFQFPASYERKTLHTAVEKSELIGDCLFQFPASYERKTLSTITEGLETSAVHDLIFAYSSVACPVRTPHDPPQILANPPARTPLDCTD